jgi:effector-binding domain-containing protein
MLTAPFVAYRPERAYAGIRQQVAMNDISDILPPLLQEVFGWLKKNNIPPDGTPFFQYLSIDPQNVMDVAVGVPVLERIEGNQRIAAGCLPAGHYATLLHTGPYSQLSNAHMNLEAWIAQSAHQEMKKVTDDGIVYWGSRIEAYLNSPQEEPDPANWRTEVAFLLADE